jgi:hypothetical protein
MGEAETPHASDKQYDGIGWLFGVLVASIRNDLLNLLINSF